MPQTPLDHSSVVYALRESDLLQRHPEAVAQLLMYWGETDSPGDIWYGGRTVVDKLLKAGLSPALEKGLKELIAKLGLTT